MKTIKIKLPFKTIKIKIPAFWKIPSWLKNIGKGMVDSFRRLVERNACLIHLGEGPLAKFNSSQKIQLSTFTVPRDRSHQIGTNSGGSKVDVTIVGDLWIQRGACLYVEGDLTVQKPAGSGGEPGTLGGEISTLLKPSGRIVLEEGATLLVGGNLSAEQVVACAPPGKIHTITSAILCQGNVVIRHGTRSSVTLDGLARGAGAGTAGDALEIFLQDIAPNLSKLSLQKPEKKDRLLMSGPFYPRAAYFSQYPIIIKVILPAGPFFPTFEKKGQNANTLIFRAFAVFYAVHLNLTLGENFTPHTDWWIFGRGRIPVFPKVIPLNRLEQSKAMFSELKTALGKFTDLSFRDTIKNFASTLHTDLLKDFFSSTLPNVIVSISKAAFDPSGSIPTSLTALDLGKIDGPDVSLGDMTQLGSRLYQLVNGESQDTNWAHHLLPECCGVLLYAKQRMILGNGGDSDLASGFFIAGGDLDLKTHTTVGAAMSLRGNLTGNNFLHYAPFASASVYRPVKLSGGTANPAGVPTLWSQSISRFKYGSRASKGEAFRFPNAPTYRAIWEGWVK